MLNSEKNNSHLNVVKFQFFLRKAVHADLFYKIAGDDNICDGRKYCIALDHRLQSWPLL